MTDHISTLEALDAELDSLRGDVYLAWRTLERDDSADRRAIVSVLQRVEADLEAHAQRVASTVEAHYS